ncbi:MAG: penicillin-binding protein 2, partial [Planktomarina sp.]
MTRTPEEINYSAMRISRRALLVGALQLSVVGGLAARMRYLQIDQAEEFRTLAEENRINETLLAPARGLIFDRAGRPVAKNVPNYKLVMKRENVPDVDATLADLQKLIYIDPFDMQDIQQKLVELKRFQDITLVENMTWEDFAKVAANAPSLPGIEAEVGLSRVYPQRGNLAHVV